MRKILAVSAFSLLLTYAHAQTQTARPPAGPAASSTARTPASAPVQSAALPNAFVEDNCILCHNDKEKSGNLSLENIDWNRPERHADKLEKALLKVRAGMMPPMDMPKPDPAKVKAFVEELESRIDRAAAANPNPGRPVLHRLNRTEYANSIRELLDIEVNVESMLPADDMSQGYDNMSDVLTISPTLLEGYLKAAGKISRLAVGDPQATPAVDTYVVPQAISQLDHVPGAPFGTRGGIVVRHNFPADAEYSFVISFYYASIGGFFGDNKPAEGEQIEISIDGERVALLDISRKIKADEDMRTKPVRVTAGPHTVAAAFPVRAAGPVEDFVMPFERALADLSTGHIAGLTGLPHLRNLGIAGPNNPTGVSDMPSRRKILSCKPSSAADEIPCARKIIGTLARQAYRRPVAPNDFENLMGLYLTGRKEGSFDSGIQMVVQGIIADPEFLFRFERTPANVAPNTNYRISDLELASRLSFFLWSTPPDEQLLTLATEGKLKNPAVLEQQVKRMIADSRSKSLADNFASHWLHLQNLKDVHPDVYLYPDWDYNLTEAMAEETKLLFDGIVREDRSVTDLISADYTYVNERLAKHYGIPNITGSRFRRVEMRDPNRRGILGHGSILTLTSLANRTSPVIRGQWILSVLMGAPPPNPPANVPPLMENEEGKKLLSVRERLEVHRSSPACASCHSIMDPIGYSLENFDPIGAWRTKDSGYEIVPSGTVFDGTSVGGPVDLHAFMKRNEGLFIRNFSQHLLMYALGRVVQPYDMPAVRSIVREAARSDNRFSAVVMAIVKSTPFQLRRAEAREATSSGGDVAPAGARR